ncbi:MAG: MotA/TolQ/ExbB proton channel family protein [Alphaproteobacteria bacterium]|nr:MotA/TolQ/ExbB proton channel family protein [Alphaproteobacteria bacterium]
MNLTYIFEQGDPLLIGVFLLLLVMSFASWWVIFLKISQHRTERKSIAAFQAQVMQTADWPLHLRAIPAQAGSISVLIQEAIKQHAALPSDADIDRREKLLTAYLSQTLDMLRVELDKGLTLLASVGSSSPFIGLFGTVWGIYGALTRIATEGNASLNVVAGPMGEALVATAVGLFAAIPAVLAYNAFARQNRLLVQDLRHVAEQMTLKLPCAEENNGTQRIR